VTERKSPSPTADKPLLLRATTPTTAGGLMRR